MYEGLNQARFACGKSLAVPGVNCDIAESCGTVILDIDVAR